MDDRFIKIKGKIDNYLTYYIIIVNNNIKIKIKMMELELEDECDLKLFDSYEPISTTNDKLINLLMNMNDLRYVNFCSDMGTVGFTESGLNWLKKNMDKLDYYVKLYKMNLGNFGPMTSYVDYLFKDMSDKGFLDLNEYQILDSKLKINEVGELVEDMNEVTFIEKAPGDISA